MEWILLGENGEVLKLGLPVVGERLQGEFKGCTVSGYNLLDEDTLREDGWLPVVDVVPEYNSSTQYVRLSKYVKVGDHAEAQYDIFDIEYGTPDPTPSLSDRVSQLEVKVEATADALDFIMLDGI
jgi:hypothetical protein